MSGVEKDVTADIVRLLMRGVRRADARAARYRLAWLSARRRDWENSLHATEALELKNQEIARLRAELERSRPDENRESIHGTRRLEYMGADEDGEVWRLAADGNSSVSH